MNHSKTINEDKNFGCLFLIPLQNLTILLKQFDSLSDENNIQDDDGDDNKPSNYNYCDLG